MSGKPLHVYYHTHWDREWYLPFRSYQVRLAEVVDEVLERLETGVLPCFTLDGQTVVLDDYLELRPENKGRLEALIRDGKISIGPWYVMPDEFLVSGESLIRNLMRGIRQAREWGYNSFTGYLPDTFGHSADMPTILRGFGIDTAILWRGVNPQHSLFSWQSPSGAVVRTLHLTEGYFQMMLDDWTLTPPERIAALKDVVQKLEAATPEGSPVLLPIGADHMGPLPAEGHDMLLQEYPAVTETMPDHFMRNLNGYQPTETITGELMDNTRAFLLPGVWSSRMYLKQANRRLEHTLVHHLEPLLAITQALLPQENRLRYPLHELDLAWKTLILNHPHDSICGCSIGEVHRENMVRFEQVDQLCDAISIRIKHTLQQLGTQDEWVIFNTNDQVYTGTVFVSEDTPLPDHSPGELQDDYLFDTHKIPLSHLTKKDRTGSIWVEDIPPYGIKIIPKDLNPAFQSVIEKENHIENEWLSVTGESDGTLTIRDKKTGKTYSSFFKLIAIPDKGDSYNSDLDTSSVFTAKLATYQTGGQINWHAAKGDDEFKIIKGTFGTLFACFEFENVVPAQRYFAAVSLKAGSPFLEFYIDRPQMEWKAYKFQIVFPSDQPITTVTAESHLGLIQRCYDPAYREADHTPVEKMKELKTNTGPIQRFISFNGQTIFTEGLTEYEVQQNNLLLTLTRGFFALSTNKLRTRGAPAGPPINVEGTTSYTIRMDHKLCFRWMPTPAENYALYQIANQAYGEYNSIKGYSGIQGSKNIQQVKELSLISWDNPAIVTSACYWKPGEGLILRLINTSDQKQTATLKPGFKVAKIRELNFLEEPLGDLPGSELSIGARDGKTFLLAVQ